MGNKRYLSHMIEQLVNEAYPDLMRSSFDVAWGKTSSFAIVSWSSERSKIRIMCNSVTKKWHEAPLFGLLSHELSHLTINKSKSSEETTDLDVISRGLGIYLAVERAITGKYEDYTIQRGKDRYLGYRTIRLLLTDEELAQLDALMQELRLIPKKHLDVPQIYHEIVLFESDGGTEVSIDGDSIYVNEAVSAKNIEITIMNDSIHIHHKGQEISNFRKMKD